MDTSFWHGHKKLGRSLKNAVGICTQPEARRLLLNYSSLTVYISVTHISCEYTVNILWSIY